MGAPIPKQYLEINNKTVIEYTLDCLISHPAINGLVIAMHPDDSWWSEIQLHRDKPMSIVDGGEERCHSVLNALSFLMENAEANDWVLVHDAARPCLRHEDIDKLLDQAGQDIGGILAMPVRDTMKRADGHQHIKETVERNQLWHALTPQMFRLGQLHAALTQAIASQAMVTDEASAMEMAGYRPLLVEGRADNIKITRPEDLALAEFYLEQK
jgi:2-C-methyl-D-erythritol 4-phosphate cytidylyltransferase